MIRQKQIAMIVAAVFTTGLASVAVAQQQEKKEETKKLERIEITGSNIKRTDSETVAPVTIITREQIERSGRATIAEVLREVPINSSNGFSETSLNSFASGGSGISLRGLGGLGTLVLFNGRRVANYPFAANLDETFVDLNQIPASVVERIEILKDGASAVYGSDAIAGVVNVIFRRDYKGAELSARIGGETKGALREAGGSVTFGRGDLGADKYNFFGVIDAYKRDGTLRKDFELTKSNDYSRYFSGEDQRGSTGGTWRAVTGPASVRNNRIPVANCSTELIPASRLSSVLTGTSCVGDIGPGVTSLLPDQKRISGFGRGTFEFSPNLQGTVDLGFSEVKTKVLQDYNYLTAGATRFVPTTVGGETLLIPQSVRYVIAPGEAGNPTGQFAELLIPSFDLGVRNQDIKSTNTKVSAGLKGTHFGWDWDSSAGIARAKASSTYNNLMSYSGVLNTSNVASPVAFILLNGALDENRTGSFVPIGANSQQVIDSIRTSTRRQSEAQVTVADIKASREIGQLSGGGVGLALGLDWRKEKLKDTPDAKLLQGDILNFGYTGTTGSRNVVALYGEVVAPVTKSLEVQAAARYDRYSDAGSATSPKIGAKFKVSEEVLLRANYGRGFRAPSLPQISKSDSTAFQSFFDYAGCDAGYAPACQGINQGTGTSTGVIFRSNPNLKPEKSQSFTFGMVIAPSADTSFGIDMYRLKWNNLVGSQNVQNLLDDEVSDLMLLRPDVLIRDPSNGALIGVINRFINFGEIRTRGVDLDFRHRLTTAIGRWGFQGEASYVDSFTQTNALPLSEGGGSEVSEFAGRNTGTQTAFPRWRGNLRTELESGDWTYGARANWIGGYRQAAATNGGQPIRNFRGEARKTEITGFTTFDLSTQYRYGKNTRIFGAVRNIFNSIPPFDPRMSAYGFAVDQYAPIGRTVSLSVRYTFE